MQIHHAARSLAMLWGCPSISNPWWIGVKKSVVKVSPHWLPVTHCSVHTQLTQGPIVFFLMGSLKLSQSELSFLLTSLPLTECEMLQIERKIANFTNESMHSYASAICQFLFIFHCHSKLSWQRHKGLISQYLSAVSKYSRYCEVMRII